jgi:hypothetical protein
MAQSSGGNSQGDQAAAIEGTWIVTVQPAGAPTGFTALMSFAAGGVTLATGANDRLPPFAPTPAAPISPLYGSWRQMDNNTYVATFNFFIFDSGGNAVNMFQNNATIRLSDDNNLAATGNSFLCKVSGDDCISQPPAGPFTFTGKRLIAKGASS